MKIFLAQQNYRIGDFAYNTTKILKAVTEAARQGGDLIVFSELAVCGYPPRDFLLFDDFITECRRSLDTIARASTSIAILVGAPTCHDHPQGKGRYNSAYFMENGAIRQVIHKTCLPTYDVFDEHRYFDPATEWTPVLFRGKKLAVTICEDLWTFGEHPLYNTRPMDQLARQHPDIMINLSASPFSYTHPSEREHMLRRNVTTYGLPVLYCNAVGSQTEIVFDGRSIAMSRTGACLGLLSAFEEDLAAFHFDTELQRCDGASEDRFDSSFTPATTDALDPDLHMAEIRKALVLGIRDYFEKMGFSRAILGSSGGIDSAVTLCLACEALGPENVTALLMPSEYSSSHSVEDALELSRRLGNPHEILPIARLHQTLLEEVKPFFSNRPPDLAEENIQSRLRGNLLMAMANKMGMILLNTSNKSELATGYGTLYGDMAGGLAVLGDCYKLQVYALARHLNAERDLIPEHILTKPPSAELRPGQKDSDSLPEYSVLDPILYQYIDQGRSPSAIKALGHDPALTDRILGLVNRNEYKRNQFCPIIRVSSKAFGVGRRMPIVARYLS